MPNLGNVVRFGYALVVVSLLLMIWASLSRAREVNQVQYPPCYFNPLCTCSKAVPDLGIVRCHDVPMPRLPPPLNTSKVFMLHMENNGLQSLEPHFFQGTGLYRLAVSQNPLDEIPDEAFLGLEHSLWELKLQEDLLTAVPSRALRHLQKLKILDLADNKITEISPESWRGLESSLQILILADNAISTLPSDAFTSLIALDTLNLHGNDIMEIDVDTFRAGLLRLTHLYLGDNQLSNIPYQQLSKLKQLRTLDLSYNRITGLNAAAAKPDTPLALDTLRLDYNQIQYLASSAFQNFEILNRTFLDGNPLMSIKADAFRDARIRELSLRDCGISDLAQGAFSGLEPSLQFLDLAGNNLTYLPESVLIEYDFLRTLNVRDNNIPHVYPGSQDDQHRSSSQSSINGYQYSLYQVDIGGKSMGATALQDLRKMRNLRSLSVSRLPKSQLSPDDFQEFGVDLEELRISESNLQTVKNHAFQHARGLKRLTLTDNFISGLEPEAFSEIGHSLIWLDLSHGLAPSVSSVFGDALRPLTVLQTLDLSNNRLKSMSETSFHFLKKLRVLNMNDNQIGQLHKGTFQGSIHRDLEKIYLSYNNLEIIEMESFADLPSLYRLHLDDNRIQHIERRAFMTMDRLKQLTLRGNNIQTVATEAFQNLPDLGILDLSYNKLSSLDLASMDQVGTISSLKLNVSHNNIQQLSVNVSGRESGTGNLQLHVKILDLSYNNISRIGHGYFKPLQSSMTHLYLRENSMVNATRDVFGNMPHLQWLDFSENNLAELDFDAFRNTKSLQVLHLSGNSLVELPTELFRGLSKLRVVSLERNKLRTLPDLLFNEEGLEWLSISYNAFSRVPTSSFGPAAATLCELDLSHNIIASLHGAESFARFRGLVRLDLSHNRLVRLEDAMFSTLPRLSSLDLSDNIELLLESRGRTFHGLADTLYELNLRNTSLTIVPDLPLNKLRALNLADNLITVAPFEMAVNLSSLRRLDMRNNRLELVPPLARLLPQLRELMLGGNQIPTLSNSSFLPAAEKLQELDLQHLPLTFFENGALSRMRSLRSFHVSPYPDIYDFNLPRILHSSSGLRNLHVEVEDKEVLTEGFISGDLPTKIRNITLSGQAMQFVPYNLLQGIRYPNLHFAIHNTTLETVPRTLFQQAKRVRNITLDMRNNSLRTLANPNTGDQPGLPRTIFLQHLEVVGNKWSCDCELGWVETWSRKRRQYMQNEVNGDDDGDTYDDDLRLAECINKNNASILHVLKTDIECGWGSKGSAILVYSPLLVLAAVFSTMLNI